MQSSTAVAVIGCGWLGLSAAKHLVKQGYQVAGSSRNNSKLAQLNQLGITPVAVDVYEPQSYQNSAIADCSIWIINIAAGRRTTDFAVYVGKMKQLIDYAATCKIAHLIFVSTTAVYGNPPGTVVETTELQPVTASGKAHAEMEEYIQSRLSARSSILRLAGLVSIDRHPARSLSKRTEAISGGKQVINLIHRTDVVAALSILCERGPMGTKPLHLASPDHPSRKDYYTWAAEQLGLKAPLFTCEENTQYESKRIDCSDSLMRLGLTLKYTSPYDMLTEE